MPMSGRTALRRAALLLALGAAFGTSATSVHAATAFAVVDASLAVFDTDDPSTVASVALTGLVAGDTLVGIDVRAQNGQLYGLGYNAVTGTAQLYAISQRRGVVRPIGAAFQFVDALGAVRRIGIDATTRFGLDFNPSVDRLRVVNSASQNFRLNPNNGVPVDGDAVNAGVQMDGDVNGATTTVDGTAYTNAVPNTTITTQYALDAASNAITIQNPPNSGTQTLAIPLTLGGTPLDIDPLGGFDIPPGVNAAVSNQPVTTGSAFALLRVAGVAGLYRINLVDGVATLLGTPALPVGTLAGFAVHGEPVPGGRPAIALSSTRTSLLRFNTTTPGTVTTVAITGIVAGESLAAIDFRPATGQLFGLGVNAVADTATLYVIDPQSATASALTPAGQLAWTTDGVTPIDLPSESSWGMDFNPTVDRVRLVAASGFNARANPDTGAPVDGDGAVIGIQADGAINLPGGAVQIAATAYTNSFNGATATSQYTLDASQGRLLIQNPPNAGTQTLPLPITVGGAPLAFDATGGFDIPPAVSVFSSATAIDFGFGFAVLGTTASSALYRLELGSGRATSLGAVGAGTLPAGLTVADGPQPVVVFVDGFEPLAP